MYESERYEWLSNPGRKYRNELFPTCAHTIERKSELTLYHVAAVFENKTKRAKNPYLFQKNYNYNYNYDRYAIKTRTRHVPGKAETTR